MGRVEQLIKQANCMTMSYEFHFNQSQSYVKS
jgi:hypothetical protein